MTNGRGVDAFKADDFAVLDKLPKAARIALGEGTENYNTAAVLRIGRQGNYDAGEYVAEIGDIMREVTRQAAIRNYGYDHPQAKDDCQWPINPVPVRTLKGRRQFYR